MLRRELDAEPEAASRDLYHAILAGRLPPGSMTNGDDRGTRKKGWHPERDAMLQRFVPVALTGQRCLLLTID